MNADNDGVIPGNALVVDPKKQFRPLSKFGNAFLNRFNFNRKLLKKFLTKLSPGFNVRTPTRRYWKASRLLTLLVSCLEKNREQIEDMTLSEFWNGQNLYLMKQVLKYMNQVCGEGWQNIVVVWRPQVGHQWRVQAEYWGSQRSRWQDQDCLEQGRHGWWLWIISD